MQEPGPNQGRQPIVRVDVALEIAQEPVEQVWRRWNEDCVPWSPRCPGPTARGRWTFC
jgi:hypothetical protein